MPRRRIALDRAHVQALQEGRLPDDLRLRPSTGFGNDWLPDLAAWQLQQVSARPAGAGTAGA